jgi:P27 family predicted phage terminase small subunit
MTRVNTGERGQPRTLRNSPDLRKITEIPPAPEYFDDESLAIWVQTAGLLIDRHDLTEGDLGQLEVFASNHALFRAVNRALAKDGLTIVTVKGELRAHPLLATRKGAEQQITISGTALGLSPASRRQLKLVDDLPGHHDKPQRGF